MASWFWTYLTFNRGARLITGDLKLPGWREQMEAGPVDARAVVAEKKAS